MFHKSLQICLVVVLLLSLITASVMAADKVRVGTPVKGHPLYELPFLAGQEKGFFKGQGLELELIPLETGAALSRAVVAGAVDIGMSGALPIVQAIVVGVPQIVIGDMQVTQDFFIFVRSDSRIREPRDIKGAKVAVPRIGGLTHTFGLVAARALGIEKDVKFVAAGGVAHQIAAVKSGAVEAMVNDLFATAPLKARGEIREVISLRDYLPKDWVDIVLFARKAFAEKSPEMVKRAITATVRSANFVLENPEWARGKIKEAFGYTDEAAKVMYGELRYGKDAKISRKGLENVLNFLIEYDIIKRERAPSLDAVYAPKFIE